MPMALFFTPLLPSQLSFHSQEWLCHLPPLVRHFPVSVIDNFGQRDERAACYPLIMGIIQRAMGLIRDCNIRGPVAAMALSVLWVLSLARPCFGYSVIMHEAIIDAEWDSRIMPFLLERFPKATPEELREAKSYAYGGSVIQDLGYYPFSHNFFSHLTHYVRSGDFVQALFEESHDINDYAFALGALSHYSADIQGHSVGVNRVVPLLYPKLRKKYGDTMTWEESPWAHALTEFGFDTVEVVAGHVAPQKYHEYIGFRVAEPTLRRAFRKTYGLELPDQTVTLRLALFTYKKMASRFIPEMTEVAWAGRGKSLEERATGLRHNSLFHIQRGAIEASWEKTRERPGVGDKLTALLFRIVPKVGPLNAFDFHTPTEEAEQLFSDSLKATIADYEVRVGDARFDPPDVNLDTGRPTSPGEYHYGDMAFAKLLQQLERTHFATITPALQDKLLGFYSDSTYDSMRRNARPWRRVQREVAELKAAAKANSSHRAAQSPPDSSRASIRTE
jgi:hypothetical protein